MTITELGDVDFAGLFAEHGQVVRGAVRRVLGHSAEEDDIAQEAFLRLMVRLRQPGEVCVPAWLSRVAHNLAIDEIRRRRPLPVPDAALDTPYHAALDDGVAGREMQRSIAEALDRLPERQRAVLLRHVNGEPVSGTHLAAFSGVSVDAAASLLARARLNMRRHLAEVDSEAGRVSARVAAALVAVAGALGALARRSWLRTTILAATTSTVVVLITLHLPPPPVRARLPLHDPAGPTMAVRRLGVPLPGRRTAARAVLSPGPALAPQVAPTYRAPAVPARPAPASVTIGLGPLDPLGTVPLGTVPLGTVPLGTVPLGTVPLGTVPLGTVPPLPTAASGTGTGVQIGVSAAPAQVPQLNAPGIDAPPLAPGGVTALARGSTPIPLP